MAVQGSTTGLLENAALEMIIKARYTAEHAAPCVQLFEQATLKPGADTYIIPKVGQMTLMGIAEREENTNEQDIGMTTNSVQTSIVGAKVVLTDFLLRSTTQDYFAITGRQLGDARARKEDEDMIALFSALNGGTTFGAAGAALSAASAIGCLSRARTNKFGGKVFIIHHPNAISRLKRDLSTVGSGQIVAIPKGPSAEALEDFFSGMLAPGVPLYEDGNITRDASDDAIGCIANQGALGICRSGGLRRSKELKEGICEGAWVLYLTARYVTFEIDDTRGAPMTYDAVDPATS